MKNRSLFLLLSSSIVLSFLSCKKSTYGGSGEAQPGNPLIGTWALVSENWQNYQSLEFTDGADLLTINSSNVTTSGPSGLFTFADSTVTIGNLSYTATSTYLDLSYKNRAMSDSVAGTVNIAATDTSVSNSYHLIGADSVDFPNGSYILLTRYSIGAALKMRSGGSFRINGNTLTITSVVDSVAHVLIFSGTVEDTVRTNNKIVAVFSKQ